MSSELDDAQIRQLVFDLEFAYTAFQKVFHDSWLFACVFIVIFRPNSKRYLQEIGDTHRSVSPSRSHLPYLQVVYFTFERLWNLTRETFAPVWSLRKLFSWKNFVLKSSQKIRSENTQKRRPRGSSIKHGEIWPAKFGQMCLPQIFQVYLLNSSQL